MPPSRELQGRIRRPFYYAKSGIDDSGAVTARYFIGQGHAAIGVDTPAGVWHTVVALSEVLVCYEVKPGPWDPATDKEFASWAPSEGSPDVERYLSGILNS